ncbi:hydrolase [Actinoplanes cyaneus]|uniref:Hydrolase n=1 Tax=Actinoplanes cyaneus TaxID=52696 RepID=A0A919MHE4_9ACTN|nr:alpha/beta hydrolase [Actinoplanes cyaneus]MCW2144526.1 proline iminopeptidase [Actinoplanes cyaneus]GID71196.1 hydrolase [Actinoplanes cyaneus]
MKEQFAEINGVNLHYYVTGSGPVLLVPAPGWGPSVQYLIPLTVLEKHCTVVYFDTRHSGKSSGPESADQYTLEHFVADIEALRVHLGAPKIFLAGHSAGGHQALAYGIEHPENLLGIIAIDANAALDDVRAAEMMKMIEKRRTEPFYRAHPTYIDDAMAAMTGRGGDALTIQDILDRTGALYFHDPELAAGAFARMEFDEQVLHYSQASGFQSRDLLPDLHRITAPTLIVVGDDDFQCDPVSQGMRMHENLPASTLAIIKDSGHFPWLEQPAAFDAACTAWFGELNVPLA